MITKNDKSNFTFKRYNKIGSTSISDQVLGVGTEVETLEGKYVCQEPSRLAVDVAGNVYPIAESVFQKCYVLSIDNTVESELYNLYKDEWKQFEKEEIR